MLQRQVRGGGCEIALRARILRSRGLLGGESRIRTLSTPRRIWSESEPPNLPTEKNAGCCAFEAPNPPSPVRMRESPTAKTPRIRGNFRLRLALSSRSLRIRGLNGGESGIRTLSRRIGSETEPANLATETNTDCGVFQARNPQSPVRVRQGPRPKPRESTGFLGSDSRPGSTNPGDAD